MNKQNTEILNALPLTDVMYAWGHVPMHEAKNGSSASYICPWHDDHRPSLVVDKVVRNGASDLGFRCFTCKQEGYGAVQLAARLMGYDKGVLAPEDYECVLQELADRCGVQLEEDDTVHYNTRTSVIGWNDFLKNEPKYAGWSGEEPVFERGTWTLEGLRSLGLKVELASRRAKRTDMAEGETTIKIGDLITQFDPDTGQPLYRCSLDKSFYRGPQKAETDTIENWGAKVEQMFGVEPVSRFVKRDTPAKSGAVVLVVQANSSYPIFIFRSAWGIKKYEPKARLGGMKWTWWCLSDDADLDHRWYADTDLTNVLEGVMPSQDKNHPFIATEKDKDGNAVKVRFERIVLCSGPRDAIAVYSHSNAHVVWLHSEQAGIELRNGSARPSRWLRAMVRRLMSLTVDGGLYVCYDEDSTGLAASQAIALDNPQVRWLRLPKELGMITSTVTASPLTPLRGEGKTGAVTSTVTSTKHLKDVTDFVTHFAEVERLMPAELQHDDPVEWFDNALFDTPSCQFWQWESERKDADGTGRARYKFDLRNTPVFLRARGMVRRVVQQGKVSFSRYFLLGNGNTFCECYPNEKGGNRLVGQARDLMAEWLRAHKAFNDEKGALSRAIYSAKLDQSVMETVEQFDFDEKSYGEDFDYFFFANTAVKVTKDGIEQVPYNQMKYWTNCEAILDGQFTPVAQDWRVMVNPMYEAEAAKHEEILRSFTTPEEKAQEYIRWDNWVSKWKYKLVMDKPLEEMPVHFRFLYNASRIFWETEAEGNELTATEKQVQDMYFVAMLHAIGSALVRHRSANRQQFVHITDNGTRREDLASGGTGKTAILELLGLVRKVLKVDGKALEGGNISLTQELAKVVPGLHTIVALDELPQGFSPKTLYNYTLSLTARGLYRESFVLEGDDLPKFVVSSNEQLDLSSDSTSRRTYQVLVSDWYHPRSIDGSRPSHTPADDFRKQYGIKEVARNLPPKLLNEARNLLLGCVQLFFQYSEDTLRPPRDSRAMLRQALASSKDEQFTMWISGYLNSSRHIGIPIAQRELAISLLDYCGQTIGEKTIKSAYKRIRDNLGDYIRTSVYTVDPPVVLSTPSDRERGYRQCATWQYPRGQDGYSIPLDENGRRKPRELVKKAPYPRVYYFYRKAAIPRHFYSPEHTGEADYVQGAPETDPDEIA